jgi:hypothetical protein
VAEANMRGMFWGERAPVKVAAKIRNGDLA